MSNLDFNYIAALVRKTQAGDGNAFAELFAATFQKQYAFAYDFLKDSFLAQKALQETYTYALNNMAKISEASVVAAWLNQINFRICFRIQSELQESNVQTLENQFVTVNRHQKFSLRQVLTLPFTESQCILLHCYCKMKKKDTASLLEIRNREVRRYIRDGVARLGSLTGERRQSA